MRYSIRSRELCAILFALPVVAQQQPAAAPTNNAQNVMATSGAGTIALTTNPALVTFVATNAGTAESAAKDTMLSTAKGQATVATLTRVVPIPIIGPFAGPLMNVVLTKFHKPKPIVGFSIAFLPGLSAATAVPQGEMSFRVPANSLQGAVPSLLRVTPSTKDSTRIVRSLHLSVKAQGPSVAPTAENTELLGTTEQTIACRQEIRDGDAVLIPNSPLDTGEYAIAMVPAAQQVMAPVGSVWDFRVVAAPPPPPPPAPPAAPTTQTLSVGETPQQVEASLGKPERIVKLGAKTIYWYPRLKVVFVNNKLTEAQ